MTEGRRLWLEHMHEANELRARLAVQLGQRVAVFDERDRAVWDAYEARVGELYDKYKALGAEF